MNRLVASLVALTWMLLPFGAMGLMASPPSASVLPLIPEAVDSFGAAVQDGWLYIYGGHRGSLQDQHEKNLARQFVRCNLRTPKDWQSLPIDEPLQQLALVGYRDHLYRIGGARAAGHKGNALASVADFARFDPQKQQWEVLPRLPAPRSAHDAIALDGKIYVVGGWHHDGKMVRDWHDSALVYDIAAGADGQWQSLPTPSFRRRNLAVAAWQNCIWAIGGKDDFDQATGTVYCYDPQRGYWSEGPELPLRSGGLVGYGVAAWGLDSGLYVSGADGRLYRLTHIYGEWKRVAELRIQRYCHRLVPEGESSLLAVAGCSVAYGQTGSVERIKVYSP